MASATLRISAAIRRGLIEAVTISADDDGDDKISAAIRRGLIEAAPCFSTFTRKRPYFRGHSPRPH